MAGRAAPVRVGVTMGPDGSRTIAPAHGDFDLWQLQMLGAAGSPSWHFATGVLSDIMGAAARDISEPEANAALALLSGMRPENEAEAALVVQMIGAHAGAMRSMRRLHNAEYLNQTEAHGRLANAFMRTYALQLQTLDKIRRRGAQTVHVEHVHVHKGGQAIVGTVETGGRAEGKSADQSHAPARQLENASAQPFAPLWGQDAEGDAVPIAGREGTAAVPNARRTQSRRASGE
jgi:hypothetical protein